MVTDYEKQRIKLAEFVGWTHYAPSEGGITDKKLWHWEIGRGTKEKRIAWYPNELPDPEHSADDCEALIRKLNELGCTLTITYAIDGEADGELLWEGTAFTTPYRKNGKMVACELAMKLIEQQEDGDALVK